MKKLLIMRGVPCSGKSTWIKDRGYKRFSLSMDTLRLMFKAQDIGTSQEYNKRVYDIFFEILETRMKNGSFTIIDNVNQTFRVVKPYLELAEKYNYEVKIIDFLDVSLEDCIKRNKLREEYKFVPEDVIRRMHQQMQSSQSKFNEEFDSKYYE